MDFSNIEYTLLTKEQAEDNALMRSIGLECMPTDFAMALGIFQFSDFDKIDSGYYYLSSFYEDILSSFAYMVGKNGYLGYGSSDSTTNGLRPVLSFSNISDIPLKEVVEICGFKEVEYGEYPRYAASILIQASLETLYNLDMLKQTGKTYTIGLENKSIYDEYESHGKKYIRVTYDNETRTLSNGEKYKRGDTIWIEVTPLRWYVDDNEKIMVSKNVIASKIRFDKYAKNCNGDFKNTEIYKFLNTCFAKDIIQAVFMKCLKMKKQKKKKEEIHIILILNK